MAIKLSEAIREGAKLRPQCRGTFYSTSAGGIISSCALGAAYEYLVGKTASSTTLMDFDWNTLFPTFSSGSVTRIIAMNDGGRTREEIADILASEGY